MATARPFAYNPSLTPIPGSTQIGTLAVGGGSGGGVTWWDGPDEELGYIIAVPVSGNTQPTPMSGVYASVGFYRSDLTNSSFIEWAQYVSRVYGNPQTFTTGYDASSWLTTNGYWNSYPILSNPDAANYVSQVTSAGGYISLKTASALDVLFNDLQNQNLQSGPTFYSALEGFYPMLGLTSATQAINGNGNTAYDLQFGGGWTFGSLGMQGNGINTFIDTGKQYIPYTGEELWNTHFSIYGTVPNNSQGPADLSIGGSERTVSIALKGNYGYGDGRYEYVCGSSVGVAGNSGDFVTISCDNGSATYAYKNGVSTGYGAGSVPYLSGSQTLYFGLGTNQLGCQTNNGPSANTYGWASFGGFMSPTDMGNYQTIVNTFMTSIGRNTY
jgi:hypothetical protein